MASRRTKIAFTVNYLKSILDYNPETGIWIWKVNKIKVIKGMQAGSLSAGKRRIIVIDGKLYLASNLVWYYMTGQWPISSFFIDHKNRIKGDDRWTNLRLVTRDQNTVNTIYHKSSGLPRGVKQHGNRFVARIRVDKELRHLGVFNTPSEAHQAYLKASEFRNEFLPE